MTSDASHTPATSSPPSEAPTASSPAPLHNRPHLVRWIVWLALTGIAVVSVYFGIRWWTYRFSHSITEDAFVEAHIVNVASEMVSGRLVRFLVDENDKVEQGQVLAEIEPVHYRDEVKQARGKLDIAESELKRQEAALVKLRKEVPLQIDVARQTLAVARTEEARAKDALRLTTDEVNKSIDEAKAAVELAQANLTLAKQEFDRYTELASQPGVKELLAELTKRGVPFAIATSGMMETAGPALTCLGLDPNVPVVTRNQVRRAKPDPDLFLAAAERLGVDITNSFVVGDSVWDLLAARRARALGIGLLSGGYGRDELDLAGAYRVYEDPKDMMRHLDEVGVRLAD